LPAPGNRLVQHLEIDLHRFARKIAFEMQHALLLAEPGGLRSCGAITVTAERSMFFEAISEKDWLRRAAELTSRKPGAPLSRSTV